jgi:hypothetical protein
MKAILIIPYVLCFPGVVDAVDKADKHLRGSNRDLQLTLGFGGGTTPSYDYDFGGGTTPSFDFGGDIGTTPSYDFGGGIGTTPSYDFVGGTPNFLDIGQPDQTPNNDKEDDNNSSFLPGFSIPPTSGSLVIGGFPGQQTRPPAVGGDGGFGGDEKTCEFQDEGAGACVPAQEVAATASDQGGGASFGATTSSASSVKKSNIGTDNCKLGSYTRGVAPDKEICCCADPNVND